MKITYSVTVEVEPRDEPQTKKSFNREDGKSMKPYLKEKIFNALRGAWQFNAEVTSVTIK